MHHQNDDPVAEFVELLERCRDLYVSSGTLVAREHSELFNGGAENFVELMEDLYKAVAAKIFVWICECDHRWSAIEQKLASVLVRQLWSRTLHGEQLKDAIREMSSKAAKLKWYALVRPFDRIGPLRNRIGDLESITIRLAHVIARADGEMTPAEAARIRSLQEELFRHLRAIPIDEPGEHTAADTEGADAIRTTFSEAGPLSGSPQMAGDRRVLPKRRNAKAAATITGTLAVERQPAAARLAEAMNELDRLIGLAEIKREVRTLANFLKVQAKRGEAGLPMTELSLHMVFTGNPGTGKTTVARIVGHIYGAMGVLKRGQLIETDRSGLVAGFAGQTAIKTNQKIDEALDGVLFIDEAYTLVSAEGDDPYGHEALQILLKRMEDDRGRLVVVLAGYPLEMEQLLLSNPGLSSRFARRLTFPDYSPVELASIFGEMCRKNRYHLCCETRAKILGGLTWLYANRDQRFGNGRTVRNSFERAIRRQADRIAGIDNLSIEELSKLVPDDVEFDSIPVAALAPEPNRRYSVECPGCGHGKDVPQAYLGENIRCPKCGDGFVAEWGELR